MKYLLTFCFILVTLFVPTQLLAETTLDKTPASKTPTTYLPTDISTQADAFAGEEGAAFTITSDPRLIIASSVQIILSILGTAFLVYGIWGGYQILNSRGDADQISKARSTVLSATGGIILIMLAFSFTLFITRALQVATGDGKELIDTRNPNDPNVRIEILPETYRNPDPLATPPDPGRIIRQ